MDYSLSLLLVGHMAAAAVGTAAAFLAEILSFRRFPKTLSWTPRSRLFKMAFFGHPLEFDSFDFDRPGVCSQILGGAPFEAVYDGKFLAKLDDCFWR